MTELEKIILDNIQYGFPVNPNPYATIAEKISSTADEVYNAVASLREQRIIRRIGASFNAAALGYKSTLVAARCSEDKIDEVAAFASGFSEVTHNYKRDGIYNLWFTVIAHGEKRLNRIIEETAQCAGVDYIASLPSEKTYKIKVDFSFSEQKKIQTGVTGTGKQIKPLDNFPADEDKKIISLLCGDIGTSLNPYSSLADKLSITEGKLEEKISTYIENGAIRRFGAILFHRRAGLKGNGMAVWSVPVEKRDEIGLKLAQYTEITHCYARPPLPDWDFNLYSMVHAPTRGECYEKVMEIAGELGLGNHSVLFSTKEYKKSSMVYFQ